MKERIEERIGTVYTQLSQSISDLEREVTAKLQQSFEVVTARIERRCRCLEEKVNLLKRKLENLKKERSTAHSISDAVVFGSQKSKT